MSSFDDIEYIYDVVLADPPWRYSNYQTQQWAVADKFYPTMPPEEIFSLQVDDLLEPKGVLFLWVTCPLLHLGVQAIEKWNLNFRGVAFVWVKTKKDGTPIGAQGVRPSIVKPLVEMVLVATKVKSGRPMPLGSEAVVQTVFAPKREHSQKPDEVHERIEALYPHASKVELFARAKRPGWDAWGNEI